MKKIMLFLILIISLVLVGCDQNKSKTEFDHYLETMENYVAKLDQLIIERNNNQAVTFNDSIKPTFLSNLEESKKYVKSDFIDVYSKQTGYEVDIERTEFLILYKDLLDLVLTELKQEDTIELDKFVEVTFADYGDVKIYCGYSSEDELMVKLEYKFEEDTVFTAFKSGYNELDRFYVKEINYYDVNNDINYGYSEFYEDDYSINFTYENKDHFNFSYHSDTEKKELTLSKRNDVIEGNEEQAASGYLLKWYDATQNRRYNVGLNDQADLLSEYYEIFNDKGIIFTYIDYDTSDSKVRFAWNLLEAFGWDFAYIDDIDSYNTQPGDGIYKDDTNLFNGDKFNAGLNSHHANLRIEKEFDKETVTNEQLNLSEYGLSFSLTELNLEYIDSLRHSALNTATDFDYYKGIDFFGNNIEEQFLSIIDEDLKYNEINNIN